MSNALSPRRQGHSQGGPTPASTAAASLQQNNGSLSTSTNSSRRSPANNASTISDAPPHVIEGPNGRILCIADVRGSLRSLNTLAAEHNAVAIIHTGDFGFYNKDSLERISDKTLRHLVQYSSLIPQQLRTKLLAADATRGPPSGPGSATGAGAASQMRAQINSNPTPLLSEFPMLLDGSLKLEVPVFTVWGACEDVAILERFRTGEYRVHNLQILDEATTRAIEVGGVRLRLFGLGGAVVMHKLFDNGEGAATIAGGQGTMWTTILQIGELIDTAQKTFDPTETRVLITHASPGREALLTQVALAVKADLTISAGLHFRYGVSYNEFSVQHDMENFRNKLVHAKSAFGEIWDTVKMQVEEVIDANQRILLNHALAATNRVPPLATATGAASEEPAWKNTWNWNLPDAAYGSLILDIKDGRISSETRSQGFNFAARKASQPAPVPTPTSAVSVASSTPGQFNGKGVGANAPRPTPPSGPAPPAFPRGGAPGVSVNKGPAAAIAGKPAPSAPSAGSPLSHNRGSSTDGSAPPQSDGEQGKQKHLGPKHERQAGGGSADKKAATNVAAPAVTASGAADPAAAEAPATKSKRSRGGQKNKGSKSGFGESSAGGETSGAEGLPSGNEGAKKDGGAGGGKGNKKKEDKQQAEGKAPAVAEGEKAAQGEKAAATAAGAVGASGSATASVSGVKSGDESGKESNASRGGGRGRSGRGRSGSGRGGGRGPRSGGLNSEGGASGGDAGGGNSSPAPARAQPAAATTPKAS